MIRRARSAVLAYLGATGRLTPERRAALSAEAEGILVAGVRLTLADWDGLSLAEREAFVKAGERLLALQASAGGVASQGPLGVAHVMSHVDGGAMVRKLQSDQKAHETRSLLELATERVVRRQGAPS